MKKLIIYLVFAMLIMYDAYGQCSAIPAAPSCPTTYTTASTAGSDIVVSPPTTGTKIYKLPSSPYTGGNLSSTNPSGYSNGQSILYVCAGQSLTLNDDVAAASNVTVIVLSGGTLNLKQNTNKTTYYIYGTLNTSSGSTNYIQGTSSFYIGSTGYWNASSPVALTTTGKIVNQGYMQLSSVAQIGSGTLCNKVSGCTKITSLPPDWNVASTYFSDSAGTGTLWVTTTSKPTYAQNLTSSTSTIKICTAQSSSYSFWGNQSNVTYGCSTSSGPSGCTIPLPISLAFFYATKGNEGVVTTWGVNKVWDSDYFIIERSMDGINWVEIGDVSSREQKDTYQEFSLIDNNPSNGINYYRLSEVDTKGNKTVYSVAYVEIDGASYSGFSMYPNPTNGDLNVNIFGEETGYDFELVDISGKSIMKTKLLPGINNLGNIVTAPGMYFAKLKVGHDTHTQKVVVQ